MRLTAVQSLVTFATLFLDLTTAAAVAPTRTYFWQSGPRPQTNAQRLAAGQPLLRPRNLYGTRTRTAPRQVPSVGTTEQWVHIELHETLTGASKGYLRYDDTSMSIERSETPGSFVFHRPAPDGWDTALEVQFPNPHATSEEEGGRSYMGIVHMSSLLTGGEKSMGPGNGNYGLLLETASQGPAGTPANDDVGTESSAFIVDPATGAVSVEWTNPDGSRVPVFAAYCEDTGTAPYLFITGDLVAGRAAAVNDWGMICGPEWSLKMVASSAP